MFKIPEASRRTVKSFALACLNNLRHYWPDNILVHLSQRLLSPGVICDSSLSQLGFPTSLVLFSSQEIKKTFQKSYVYVLWLTIHYSLNSGCWLYQPSGSWASNKASTVGSLAISEVRFGKFFFVILQPFSFKHSLNLNLMNSQFVGIFCQDDSTIVQCLIDKLLSFPLAEIHCRPSACKLFFFVQSVLQALKIVNRGFGHSKLLEGIDSGICAKRVIN